MFGVGMLLNNLHARRHELSASAADAQQRQDELAALEAIYGDDCIVSEDAASCQVCSGARCVL